MLGRYTIHKATMIITSTIFKKEEKKQAAGNLQPSQNEINTTPHKHNVILEELYEPRHLLPPFISYE